MNEAQKQGAMRTFLLAAAATAVVVGGASLINMGPSLPGARLTRVVARVDCATDAGQELTAEFGQPCVTGYWMAEVCAMPSDAGEAPLPEVVEHGMFRLSHQAEDRGDCHSDAGLYVNIYPPDVAPHEAACGPGCELLDGGAAPAGNRYLAPGTFKEPLPAGCYRRPAYEWAGLDGTPPGCMLEAP